MSRLTKLIRACIGGMRRQHDGVDKGPELPLQLPSVRYRQLQHVDWSGIRNTAAPEYADLAAYRRAHGADGPPPIFITARFRSGSTLLWNILRHTSGLTTYYEPLHPTLQLPPEQRLPAENDPTHTGVEDYWCEYDRIEGFVGHRAEAWDRQDLYLDALDWKPVMAEYLQMLVRSAAERPVLQFNRADFRLAWLRHMFPEAQVVHLFRHPRDQWLSVLRDPSAFGPNDTAEQFMRCDHFFLIDWAHELSARFPILDWKLVDHPYQMHYLLWKLSYLWGRTYSDLSLSYEQLLTAPQQTLSALFNLLGIDLRQIPHLTCLIRPRAPGKWRTYATATWFATHEDRAEQLLSVFLGQGSVALGDERDPAAHQPRHQVRLGR